MATKKQNRPMKSSVVRPGMKKPGPRQTKELTGKAAIDAYQKEISPKGMAKTKAAQTAALDKLMKQRYGKKK
jgi:hypothetical protein